MIELSIIIPTYNRHELLGKCLASVYREILGAANVEVIVVDDGSDANEAEENRSCCHRYATGYFCNSHNRGMAVARNRGIVASSGNWIVFLDDDVTCDSGWYTTLLSTIHSLNENEAGFEGRVNPSGHGVWDREVQNVTGGACLTCHFGVRRRVLDLCGLFDEAFSVTGPYCEDQEFAARVMAVGTIVFVNTLSVTHAPRRMNLLKYLVQSPRRCVGLLLSDRYFYKKHPDRYRFFRYHQSFWGTLRSYLLRHVISTLKRRSVSTLFLHPLQTVILVTASSIEQITAWVLLPYFIWFERRNRNN